MAREASSLPSGESFSTNSPMRGVMRWMGMFMPIIPVEQTRT
jgi:hypothetical protein